MEQKNLWKVKAKLNNNVFTKFVVASSDIEIVTAQLKEDYAGIEILACDIKSEVHYVTEETTNLRFWVVKGEYNGQFYTRHAVAQNAAEVITMITAQLNSVDILYLKYENDVFKILN
jgi:hypothetical protein